MILFLNLQVKHKFIGEIADELVTVMSYKKKYTFNPCFKYIF